MLKHIFLSVSLLFVICLLNAQNSDNKFQRPLDDVFQNIEQQYQVDLSYSSSLVKGKTLNYANWRFRPTIEETLTNVLLPFNLVFEKKGENTYRITKFKYHQLSLKEGVEKLDYLASLYSERETWEARKADLRQCFLSSLRLSKLPKWPKSKPITTNHRKMNGYQVENLALEVLPGLYVCGSVYKPAKLKGKVPVILCPNGHFSNGRYNKDNQSRCAMLAQMGAIVMNYDLFGWGESLLQFKSENHRTSLAMTVQALNSLRILDYLLSLENADSERVGITGGSGGGSHTMLISAIDERIKVSVPVVMLSCYFYGGCPCESGQPVHLCGGGTNNVEMAAMFAPKPLLVISDGGDWSSHVPEYEFPFLQRVYRFYDKENLVKNVHLPDEGHNYAYSKRIAMYDFMGLHLNLNTEKVKDKQGNYDESDCTIEDFEELYVFGNNAANLPTNALKSFDELVKLSDEILSE